MPGLLLLSATTAQAADFNTRTIDAVVKDCPLLHCPQFTATLPVFPADAKLSDDVAQALVSLTAATDLGGACGAPQAAGLQAMADDFVRHGKPESSCWLNAGVDSETPKMLVLALSAEGGHRVVSRWLNYDRLQHRSLSLDDVLLPGQRKAYFAAVAASIPDNADTQAFCHKLEDIPTTGHCTFPDTELFELVPQAFVLLYQEPPQADGASAVVSFGVPYAKLKGIVRPEFLQSP